MFKSKRRKIQDARQQLREANFDYDKLKRLIAAYKANLEAGRSPAEVQELRQEITELSALTRQNYFKAQQAME